MYVEANEHVISEYSIATAYHTETLGYIEHTLRSVNEYLRSYLDENKSHWHVLMRYFSFCHYITPHESYQCRNTPFEIMFRRVPNTFENLNSR